MHAIACMVSVRTHSHIYVPPDGNPLCKFLDPPLQLTKDLMGKSTDATVIFEDNQSAISMAKNPQFHGRAKHIDIKYHFIREQVKNGTVRLKYCKREEMIADMLTKGLCSEKFAKLREMTGVKMMAT